MTTARLLLGPGIVALALARSPRWLLALCILFGLGSDVFDGILARRLQVATEFLRRYDSAADTVFYLGVAVAAWVLYPWAIRRNAFWLGALLGLEAFRYLLDWMKFRQAASYHSWFAKAWGLVLAAATVALLGFGVAGVLLRSALVIGAAANLECVAMSLVLRKWHHDVPTIWHALRLRRENPATGRSDLKSAAQASKS